MLHCKTERIYVFKDMILHFGYWYKIKEAKSTIVFTKNDRRNSHCFIISNYKNLNAAKRKFSPFYINLCSLQPNFQTTFEWNHKNNSNTLSRLPLQQQELRNSI